MGSIYSSLNFDTPRTIPRAVKARVFFSNPIAFMGILFFLIGTTITSVLLPRADYKSVFVFRNNDPSVSGVLYDVSSTGNKINKRTVYDYTYRYTVKGTEYEGHSFSTTHHEAGDTLIVRYKADKPETSHIEGMRSAAFPLIFICFMVIFPFIGLIFLITGFRKFSKHIHLLTHGVLTSGKVIRKEPTNVKINKQTIYKVYFQFKLQNNTVQEAYVKTHITHNLGDEAQEPLIYDAQDPASAVLLDALPKQVRILLTNGTAF